MDTGPERAETVGRRQTCTRTRSPFTLPRWSHARLCTDDPGQELAQGGRAVELVAAVLPPPEHDPPDQELLDDRPALAHLLSLEVPPVGDPDLQLPLGGVPMRPFRLPGVLHLGLSRIRTVRVAEDLREHDTEVVEDSPRQDRSDAP